MRYLLLSLLLSSCVVGQLTTPAPTSTLWPTNTPSPTPVDSQPTPSTTPAPSPTVTHTLTAVNISPTPDYPTPTLEIVSTWAVDCVPNSYGQIQMDTWLYKDTDFRRENAWVLQGEFVDFVQRDPASGVWWVITTDGVARDGYVPPWVLPETCQ